MNRQAARLVECPGCGNHIVPGFTECPSCQKVLIILEDREADMRDDLMQSEARKLGLELFRTFRVPRGLGQPRDAKNIAFLKELDEKRKKKKHNPPWGYSGYRQRFEQDAQFRMRMEEQGRDITFCDAYLNATWEEERIRREKGAKYAAARKAEWESWREGTESAIPEYGSSRSSNQGKAWQHVGKIGAALAAASAPKGADAASTAATVFARSSAIVLIPAGANWTFLFILVAFIVALVVYACYCIEVRKKCKTVNQLVQTEESGPVNGDIFISPAGECYHKTEKCRGLKVARHFSARRPCNVCIE